MRFGKNRLNSEVDEVRRIDKLCDEVRNTAYQCVERLWDAFLEVGELDMLRATERALRLMMGHGDYTGTMQMLEGIYALVEIAPAQEFTDCQQNPALAQMFMEAFLARSGNFIFDMGMDDLKASLSERGQ